MNELCLMALYLDFINMTLPRIIKLKTWQMWDTLLTASCCSFFILYFFIRNISQSSAGRRSSRTRRLLSGATFMKTIWYLYLVLSLVPCALCVSSSLKRFLCRCLLQQAVVLEMFFFSVTVFLFTNVQVEDSLLKLWFICKYNLYLLLSYCSKLYPILFDWYSLGFGLFLCHIKLKHHGQEHGLKTVLLFLTGNHVFKIVE